MKCAWRHLLCVHSLRERSWSVQTFIYSLFFRFHRSTYSVYTIPTAPVWFLVYALTRLPLSHSGRPAYFRPRLRYDALSGNETPPPSSCELHKHKSDEDKDRIPGGPTANIAAAAHIAHILPDNCSCVLPGERADLGEIGLLLRIENVSKVNRKIYSFLPLLKFYIIWPSTEHI